MLAAVPLGGFDLQPEAALREPHRVAGDQVAIEPSCSVAADLSLQVERGEHAQAGRWRSARVMTRGAPLEIRRDVSMVGVEPLDHVSAAQRLQPADIRFDMGLRICDAEIGPHDGKVLGGPIGAAILPGQMADVP